MAGQFRKNPKGWSLVRCTPAGDGDKQEEEEESGRGESVERPLEGPRLAEGRIVGPLERGGRLLPQVAEKLEMVAGWGWGRGLCL